MIQKRTSLVAKFEQKFQLLGVPFSKASFYSSLKGFKSVLFPTEETKLDQIFKLLLKQETLKPNSFFLSCSTFIGNFYQRKKSNDPFKAKHRRRASTFAEQPYSDFLLWAKVGFFWSRCKISSWTNLSKKWSSNKVP